MSKRTYGRKSWSEYYVRRPTRFGGGDGAGRDLRVDVQNAEARPHLPRQSHQQVGVDDPRSRLAFRLLLATVLRLHVHEAERPRAPRTCDFIRRRCRRFLVEDQNEFEQALRAGYDGLALRGRTVQHSCPFAKQLSCRLVPLLGRADRCPTRTAFPRFVRPFHQLHPGLYVTFSLRLRHDNGTVRISFFAGELGASTLMTSVNDRRDVTKFPFSSNPRPTCCISHTFLGELCERSRLCVVY